jgi:hypothetical protein
MKALTWTRSWADNRGMAMGCEDRGRRERAAVRQQEALPEVPGVTGIRSPWMKKPDTCRAERPVGGAVLKPTLKSPGTWSGGTTLKSPGTWSGFVELRGRSEGRC